MKIAFDILGYVLLMLALTSLTMFLIQRRREKNAQSKGVVVYASLVSSEPVRGFSKLNLRKITLRVQEPDSSPREVSLRSRVDPKQKFVAGSMLPVAIDPKNPKRVYPATPESAKRAVLTGSRQQRRIMQSELRSPGRRSGQRPPSGYQPPASRLR